MYLNVRKFGGVFCYSEVHLVYPSMQGSGWTESMDVKCGLLTQEQKPCMQGATAHDQNMVLYLKAWLLFFSVYS